MSNQANLTEEEKEELELMLTSYPSLNIAHLTRIPLIASVRVVCLRQSGRREAPAV